MRIALWGAGKYGEALLKRLDKSFKVEFFVDSDVKKQGKFIDGLKVYEPEVLLDKKAEAVVISTGDYTAVSGIASVMSDRYDIPYGSIRMLTDKNQIISEVDLIWPDKPFLPYLEVNLINECNLNCKGCTHFSNLFAINEDRYSLDEYRYDIQRISQVLCVDRIRLLGGEPLLIDEIGEYIKATREVMPHADINVVTNGLKVPSMSRDTIRSFIDNDALLVISTYEPTYKMISRIKVFCEDNGIRYKVSEKIERFKKFIHINGEQEKETSFKHCNERVCKILIKGRLYRCPLAGTVYKLADTYKLEGILAETKGSGIDIYDENTDWNKVLSEYSMAGDICGCCDEQGGCEFDWQPQNRPELEDWIV